MFSSTCTLFSRVVSLKLSIVPEKRSAGVVERFFVVLDVIVDAARARPSVEYQPVVQRLAVGGPDRGRPTVAGTLWRMAGLWGLIAYARTRIGNLAGNDH